MGAISKLFEIEREKFYHAGYMCVNEEVQFGRISVWG